MDPNSLPSIWETVQRAEDARDTFHSCLAESSQLRGELAALIRERKQIIRAIRRAAVAGRGDYHPTPVVVVRKSADFALRIYPKAG